MMTINDLNKSEAVECRKRFEHIPPAKSKSNTSSQKDIKRALARKKIELIEMAKEIGCDVDDLAW